MHLYTSEEIKIADNEFTENNFEKLISLIERAGKALFSNIPSDSESVCIVAGNGNNGADGLACARLLKKYGYKVYVFVVSRSTVFYNAVTYLIEKLEEDGVTISKLCGEITSQETLKEALCNSDVTIDCLLGTGFKGDLSPLYADIIDCINKYSEFIVSADMPSGVYGDSGAVAQNTVRANKTVTFVTQKIGNVVYPGKEYCGETVVADIGMPMIKRRIAKSIRYFSNDKSTLSEVNDIIEKRNVQGHKGTFGKVLIIGGSEGMTGAAIMAAKAAYRSGAGVAYIASPRGILHMYETSIVEAVKIPLGDYSDKYFSIKMIEELLNISYSMDCIIIGPGLGRKDETLDFVREFIKKAPETKLIVDADGLFAYNNNVHGFSIDAQDKDFVVTPHDGEFFRLIGRVCPTNDRITLASDMSSELGGTVLLKGASTVITSANGDFTVNGTGNSGMATGGSGDVLSGIIAGIAASAHMNMYDATSVGAFIHGLAGDIAAEKYGEISLIASDMIEFIPEAFKRVVSNEKEY